MRNHQARAPLSPLPLFNGRYPVRLTLTALHLTPIGDTPGASGDPAAGAGGGGGNPNPGRTFTQAELDEILSERLATERRKLSKKYEGFDVDEFNRLKTEAQQREQQEAEAKKNYDAALKSANESWVQKEQSWKKTQEELLADIRTERIRNAIIGAAAPLAVDANEVADLLEKRVKLDDTRQPVVLDDAGNPAFKDGKPLTVAQLVSDYLDRKPHLAKASGTAGAGASGGASTSGAGDKREAPSVKEARSRFEDAQKKANSTRSTADIAAMHRAKRELDAAEKAAKAK